MKLFNTTLVLSLAMAAYAQHENLRGLAAFAAEDKAAWAGIEDPTHASINLMRKSAGLSELQPNAALTASAAQTVELAAFGGEVDDDEEIFGDSPAIDRAIGNGYNGTSVAQALYKDNCAGAVTECGAGFAQALLADDSKSKKVMDPDAKYVGTAAFVGKDGIYYAQHIGK